MARRRRSSGAAGAQAFGRRVAAAALAGATTLAAAGCEVCETYGVSVEVGPSIGDVDARAIDRAGDGWIVVGDAGAIVVGAPGEWSRRESPSAADLRGVAIDPGGGVGVIVGAGGVLLRTDDHGARWSSVASPTARDLHGVSGFFGRFVAVGDGVVLRSDDGAAWEAVPGPFEGLRLRAVVDAGTEVWIAGDGGALLRGTGSAWELVESGVSGDLIGLSRATSVAITRDGVILRQDELRWEVALVLERPLVALDPSGRWVVDVDGAVHHLYVPEAGNNAEATALRATTSVPVGALGLDEDGVAVAVGGAGAWARLTFGVVDARACRRREEQPIF
ncbi:MAG: hypothetical protein R3B09_19200 [Nannocystaceae bacterium]